MENNIPLQNLNQNLNHNQEERQTTNDLASRSLRTNTEIEVCALFTFIFFFLIIGAYYLGVESCKERD